MTRALHVRRKTAGRAVIPAAAATAALMLVSSAAAAAPGHRAGPQARDSVSGSQTRGPAARSLRTLFSNVRVFSSASTEAVATGQLGRNGTAASVRCWTTGADYNGDPIWYDISAPVAGYVAAFSMAAHFAPALRIPHCASSAFRAVFNALEVNLRIRAAPSTTAAIDGYLPNIGSKVTVNCYVSGGAILQDPIWYHAIAPVTGYVTGRFLNTGGDPALGVPRC